MGHFNEQTMSCVVRVCAFLTLADDTEIRLRLVWRNAGHLWCKEHKSAYFSITMRSSNLLLE